MSTTATTQAPCPIQRILIFFPRLPERCMEGKPLGEDAGMDEIREQIFFYHHAKRFSENSSPSTENVTEEAVQFLSLCIALYTLPSSLGKYDGGKTSEIFFGKSTLVFVPLEAAQEILAVVQLPRQNGGGNPLAVRKSVERCHSLFCLFRGGGIVHQLRNFCFAQKSTKCPFPGMDVLFSLRKELRKANDKISRLRSEDKDYTQLILQIEVLGTKIDDLLRRLPIQTIRRDLDAHYKEYLADMSIVMSRQGGGLRCLVDCIPIPIPQTSGHHTFQSAPSTLHPNAAMVLSKKIQQFLERDENRSCLLGVSTFHAGYLLNTHSSNDSKLETSQENRRLHDVSKEIISLIMGYMASYRTKMAQMSNLSSSTTSTRSNTPAPLGIKNLELAFSSMKDNAQESSDNKAHTMQHVIDHRLGAFLHPPPPFMMSELDDCQYFEIHNGQKVWAPRLHIPSFGDSGGQNGAFLVARAVLFEAQSFSFLLFLDTEQSKVDHDSFENSATTMLASAQTLLSTVSMEVISSDQDRSQNEITAWAGGGIDLILVDRDQDKLILFSDRDQQAQRGKKRVQPKEKAQFHFLGFGSKKGAKRSNRDKRMVSLTLEWSALGLDCRHFLASHLHLDVLLAFDDMMNESAKSLEHSNRPSIEKSSPHSNSDGFVELCTCMTLGWVYAFVNDEMEMYAFFDNSTYVTVADVQNAVGLIKEKKLKTDKKG
eukprot:scaffold672_cov126-Cylindrotheca_fusiformis.AAC.4